MDIVEGVQNTDTVRNLLKFDWTLKLRNSRLIEIDTYLYHEFLVSVFVTIPEKQYVGNFQI